ncbi:MAG: hypothetical protein WCA46_30830 [Actinocatenispora sp.]
MPTPPASSPPTGAGAAAPLGRPVDELDEADALALGVRPAIAVRQAGLPALPDYLPRPHDDELRAELARVSRHSKVVMLLGEASTGTTRACFEAVRATLPEWRVWHPLPSDGPDVVERALREGRVGPRTVLWLDDAQRYLVPAEVGERLAAALVDLVVRDGGGPVVVLGSLWPEHWRELTDPSDDGHPEARALLAGSRLIRVPSSFDGEDLDRYDERVRGDLRLALAVRHGRGRLTRYLAGVPELLRRYDHADDHVRAVVHAAMDARRLSSWRYLPAGFLQRAAPGYLDPDARHRTPAGDAWFAAALADLTRPCRGTAGPLTRLRADATSDGYQLAGCLDQFGRAVRKTTFPPASFWDAACHTCADPRILGELGNAAHRRGLLLRAYQLGRRAAELGGERADTHRRVDGPRREPATDHDAIEALRVLAHRRAQAGDHDDAEVLAVRAAEQGNTGALRELAVRRAKAGDHDRAERLAVRTAAYGNTRALVDLARLREKSGDHADAERLALGAATYGNTRALVDLARQREQAGAERLLRQAATHGDTRPLRDLAQRWEREGDHDGAERLARHAADHGGTEALVELAWRRDEAGDHDDAERLLRLAGGYGDTEALRELCERRAKAGDHADAERLALSAVDHGDPEPLWMLARQRELAGDVGGAEDLAHRAAARGVDGSLAELVRSRERAGDPDTARCLRRYGLDDRGHAADPWDPDAP